MTNSKAEEVGKVRAEVRVLADEDKAADGRDDELPVGAARDINEEGV